ncbi:hypothetical protein SCG7086_BO_00060 [Chlamydiales bacterium SCGC AG-110-P3]|nr:hypothetical protein SCG7086_BO_00060 [Chlamydiales bacterium SCGC AG-110-P3]
MTIESIKKRLPQWSKRRHLVQFLVLFTFFTAHIPLPIRGLEQGTIKLDFNTWHIHFFGLSLAKEHFYLFFMILPFALVTLIIVAFIMGKIFCGYICPQNIYYELLYRMHQKLKKRYPRYRRSKRIQNATDLAITLVLATATVLTLNQYFIGAHYLFHAWISCASFGFFVTLVHFMKHRFCTNACPYHFVQRSLQTRTTLHVNYESDRPGAPCGVCYACVKACYVDIDIRKDRFHPDCTLCGACIDACEGVYRNKAEPSLLKLSLVDPEQQQDTRWGLKLFLVGVIGAMFIGYGFMFMNRPMEKVLLARDATASTATTADKATSNMFRISIKNLRSTPMTYQLTLSPSDFRFIEGTDTLTVTVPEYERIQQLLVVSYVGQQVLSNISAITIDCSDAATGDLIQGFNLNYLIRPIEQTRGR